MAKKDLDKPYVRATTTLTGQLRKMFLEDLADREEKESVLLREIIRQYYAAKKKTSPMRL